jgi:putative aminopeptidase FrvX
MYKSILSFLLLLASNGFSQTKLEDAKLLSVINQFAKTSSVTGREQEAASFVQSLFDKGTLKMDKLGNIVLVLGSGTPRRLFTAPLDEPGYVISQIQEDGYLRITPAGRGHMGTNYHQFIEGNEIRINTEQDIRYGVATVPSSHYDRLRAIPERTKTPFQWQEAFVDIGVNSAKAVAAKGIQLLDPVTLNKKPQLIGESVAVSAAKEKSAVIALAVVAQTLMNVKFQGTVVIAWVTLDLLNGKGLANAMNKYGPFDEVVSFNRLQKSVEKTASKDFPLLSNTVVNYVGLPSTYTFSPVEMVSLASIKSLIQTWLATVENKQWTTAALKEVAAPENKQAFKSFVKEEEVLSKLISRYAVSTQEKPVRDYILSVLPGWAKPVTDEKGNIVLSFGKGKQHLAFVAHMDETGFLVDTIRDDGRLVLKEMGGFFNWVWEGHAALIHTGQKDIPALFEPRANYMQAVKRDNDRTPTVYAGFASRQEALDAGVREGSSSVTMPKQMIRLSEEKATARGFDDRTGCAALLQALVNIDPDQLPFKITFVWSVEEETGLTGSTFAAKSLQDLSIVYPVDTYVSSDAPMESKGFGYCPLGNGAVIRVLESVNFASRNHLKYLQNLASKNNIQVQYGMTAGGTDGQGFLSYDIPSVPISWPGRYSHSPIEVMDFRDMNNLVKLIKAIMLDKNKIYQ